MPPAEAQINSCSICPNLVFDSANEKTLHLSSVHPVTCEDFRLFEEWSRFDGGSAWVKLFYGKIWPYKNTPDQALDEIFQAHFDLCHECILWYLRDKLLLAAPESKE